MLLDRILWIWGNAFYLKVHSRLKIIRTFIPYNTTILFAVWIADYGNCDVNR